MVTVGLDSKVVVWSGYTFEKLKTLVGHQSHVKGITFDPANKYFATASDDRTIKIWRFSPPGPNTTSYDQVNNFTLEKSVSTPFTASPLTTYFRRCSWSPDGNHIAAANAVNGPVSSVAIINRGSWDSDINLIGHEGPTEVCAFSPRLFSNIPLETVTHDRPPAIHTVIACGGQDKALSVWITTKPRPLTIAQDIAEKSVSDLSWTPDGKKLFVSSLDGTIIAIAFESSELGFEMRLDENDKALAKFGAGRRGAGIIEGPDGLLLEEMSRQGEMRGVEGRMGALMGDQAANAPTVLNGEGPTQPIVNGFGGSVDGANGDPAQAPSQSHDQSSKAKEDPNAAKLERLKSRVTITKDGKKRIAPLLVSSAAGAESSLPKPQLMNAAGNNQAAPDQPQTILDLSKPFDGLPQGGLAALLLGNKRRLAAVEGVEDDHIEKKLTLSRKDGAVPIVTDTPNGLVPAKATAPPRGQQPTPEYIRPAVTNPSLITSQVRLAVPKIRSHIVRTIGANGSMTANGINGTDQTHKQNIIFEARNPNPAPRIQDQEPCRLTVTKRGQPIFQDYLPRNTLLITGTTSYWAAACEDGSVYAWTPSGRRLLNALILESQPVILDCQNQYLLCITAVGICHVWDMSNLTSPHPPVSLAPILDIATHSLNDHVTKAPALTGARLNSEGRIIITLTNGEGYAYNPSMYVWQRLSELWWMVGSQYWNTTDSSVGNLHSASSTLGDDSKVSAGVIPYLERSTTNATLARGRARLLQQLVKQLLSREGFEGFESAVSIAHLENRVAAAMMLGAKEDFRVYLFMYAKRIGAEGLRGKVEELLRSLMGDVYEEDEEGGIEGNGEVGRQKIGMGDRYWKNQTDRLCGWPRQELLKGVVLILGTYLSLIAFTALGCSYHSWSETDFSFSRRQESRFAEDHCTVCKSVEYYRGVEWG